MFSTWMKTLARDLRELGQQNVCNVERGLLRVTLVTVLKERHELLIHIMFRPGVLQETSAVEAVESKELPPEELEKVARALGRHGSIVDAYREFCTIVARYEEAWLELREIDMKCNVKMNVGKMNTLRRNISLNSQSILIIMLNPDTPHSRPQCEVLGSDEGVCVKWNKMIEDYSWNKHRSVADNLIEAFKDSDIKASCSVSSEMTTAKQQSDGEKECIHCYEEFNGEKPFECRGCHLLFHYDCIKTLSVQRGSFFTGECPNCRKQFCIV